MKTNGVGIGAGYGAASWQEKQEKQDRHGTAEGFEAAKKEVYVRRPPADRLGQESVMDSFLRMSQACSGAWRAMAVLEEELSDRTAQRKTAMEGIFQEYDALVPEEDKADALDKIETESRIIVKPDGSRVLVITTITNGVVTSVKSMEISEPTDEPNESGQEGESEAEQADEGAGLPDAASQLEGAVSKSASP